MPTPQQPIALRETHLAGGLQAFKGLNSSVSFHPWPGDKVPNFDIQEYHQLFPLFTSLGLKVLGVDFTTDSESAKGIYPPEWRPVHDGWIVSETVDLWSHIGHAASLVDDYSLFDISRRIGFQLNNLSWTLRDLSTAYYQELNGVCSTGRIETGKRFETLNSQAIYRRTDNFFSSYGALRDLLAEFGAKFIWNQPNVRSMASLIKTFRGDTNSRDDLRAELISITDQRENQSGWLKEASDYRDVVTHYAPLVAASHRAFIQQVDVPIGPLTATGVSFLLPANPAEIKRIRSKGEIFQSIEQWMNATMNEESDGSIDSLEYCHTLLGELAALAARFAARSPIEPQQIVLTDDDLAGPISFK